MPITIGNNTMSDADAQAWWSQVHNDPFAIAQGASKYGATADQLNQIANIANPNGTDNASTNAIIEYVNNNMQDAYTWNQDGQLVPKPKAVAPSAATQNYQQQGMAGDFRSLNDGDWEALQKSIYDSSTAGLARQEELARAGSNQSMSNRGIWSSGIAERSQNDITGQLGAAYQQAGANAANTRYQLQNNDNQSYNSYNLSNQSLGNQYDLGKESNANNLTLGMASNSNQLQSINDSYALNRATLLNEANANASNAAWQAQWTPMNTLSGLWNGTGGTISSGSSGGGWNFMI